MTQPTRRCGRTVSTISARCVCAALAAALAACAPKKEAPKAAAPEVSVVEVALRDVPIGGELTASVRGFEDVEIRARVEGYLKSIDYREGSEVQKGQLLFTIDDQPYKAKIAEAKGELARNRHPRTGQKAARDFLQRDLGEIHPRVGLRQGPVSLRELAHAPRHEVDKQLWVRNSQLCRFQKFTLHS